MPGVPAAGNDMLPGEVLKANTSIMSTNGQFRLTYQDDANLVLYRTGDGAALWDTRPQPGGPGECIMQADGNLVVYNAAGAAMWASNTNGNPGAHLILQDDGNVVIYRPDGAPVWASNTVEAAYPDGVPAAGNDMLPGEVLKANTSIMSTNGQFRLTYQDDANLVLYRTGDGAALWDTRPQPGGPGECIMQADGNLVVYNAAGAAMWASNTNGNPGAHLILQDDGNVVIYRPDGAPVWASNTVEAAYPDGVPAAGNDMLPGEVLKANTSIMSTNGQFRLTYQDDANLVLYRTGDGAALWDTRPQPGGPGECIMQADGNLVVYNAAGAAMWASNTNGNPGAHLILQDDGNVVIYRPDGAPVWASNTVEAAYPDGVPAAGNDMLPGEVLKANTSIMSTNGQFRLTYQDDANLVLYRTGDGAALWDTRPQPGGPGECIMQADGNLVVYNAAGAAMWASNTNGNPGAHLILQDDGNVVIYRPDGALLWARIIPAPSWAHPAITDLTDTSVILHWQAVPATQIYFIDYAYLSTGRSPGIVWETSYTEAGIPDLTPATGYEFHLTYRTVSGKYSDPAKIRLSTLAPSVSAVTEPATNIGADSATLNGTVQSADSAASYYFEYGLTTAYGTKAAGGPALSPGAVHQVSQAVSKLQSGATYHFRIVASNAKETATGNDAKLTTPAKSGIDFISLPQDAIGSFNYSADVNDPNELAVELGQATPARITALTSMLSDCSLSVGGPPRFNLIAGQTVTWFNGKLVKGTWSAEFSGNATHLPAGIPFRVTWTRP